MKNDFILALALTLAVFPAVAEPLPVEALDKDYQNCVGTDTDPNRAAFCACVRDGMKNWDLDTYIQTATEAAAANSAGQSPGGKLNDLAKSCLSKTLR